MEVWKNTQYTNYEVSSLSRVRNIKTGNILQCPVSSNGYRKASLSGGVTIEVHRLVAMTFLVYTVGQVVNHIDEDKLNNQLINLEWVSQKQNVIHSLKPRIRNPKLTTVQKQYIKNLYVNGMSCIKITAHCNSLWGRTSQRKTYTSIAKN